MDLQETTFTNTFGEALGPLLVFVRSTYFFEPYVFMPLMTAISIPIFLSLIRCEEFKTSARKSKLWFVMYYSLCFLATNVTAVAFKTLIVEELDYTTHVWYEAFVGPMHFYILSVILSYLWLISQNCGSSLRLYLIVYIQIGLLGGYATGLYRLLNEPLNILDPTSGVSGILFLIWFGIFNWDILRRVDTSHFKLMEIADQKSLNQNLNSIAGTSNQIIELN
ncbi:hypothetical protein [Gimesia aquarii]|uniref:Uncharacterized protein n=1 Tax=Gimesia aquarii TaxID=2527964 RepID=A0A517WRV1_9PLAN|nr:hypothetical protein [Gimesia aquarii]QDU07985.1 hypothetical protein V202x_13470 [Gimesia aquarii]